MDCVHTVEEKVFIDDMVKAAGFLVAIISGME